jgi:hypothetical protein
MPSRLIEKNERMSAWRDRNRDFLEIHGSAATAASPRTGKTSQ